MAIPAQNEEVILLPSAARTTTQTSGDLQNLGGHSALRVILDMTDVTASPSVTLTIQGKDPASGKYYTILAGAAVTTVTVNQYKVSPTVAASANAIAQDDLPPTFRILVTANNANAGTYSVGYTLVR